MSKEKTIIKYESTYETTRVVSIFIEVVGWLSIGGIAGVLSADYTFNGLNGLSLALALVLIGLPLILAGQITRAVVDNADANRQMLEILKNKENVEFSEDE